MTNTHNFFRSLDFTSQFNRVVDWNALARNGKHDFSEKTITFQKTLVQEETEELLEAVESGDKVLALDALCDMFVVGAYWYFLQNEGKSNGYLASLPLHGIDYVKAAKFDIEQDSSFMFMMATTSMLYKFDGNVTGALEEVLSSNDSKFPKVVTGMATSGSTLEGILVKDSEGLKLDEVISPEEMCSWIESQNVGRYTGVTYKIVGKGDDRRYVFLSDKGKIVKPATFFEPKLEKFI